MALIFSLEKMVKNSLRNSERIAYVKRLKNPIKNIEKNCFLEVGRISRARKSFYIVNYTAMLRKKQE